MKNRVSGISIKNNIEIQSMMFTINDLAYMSDIDALNNKIEQIEEHSHTNDQTIEKLMNTYLTVDEKNEAVDLLKSRIETLEAKNRSSKTIFASFEARIAALENLPLDWKNDYSSFI